MRQMRFVIARYRLGGIKGKDTHGKEIDGRKVPGSTKPSSQKCPHCCFSSLLAALAVWAFNSLIPKEGQTQESVDDEGTLMEYYDLTKYCNAKYDYDVDDKEYRYLRLIKDPRDDPDEELEVPATPCAPTAEVSPRARANWESFRTEAVLLKRSDAASSTN